MDIKTCTRGFSFMPKNTFEVADLKYVEKDALEQTWRASRRERLKQQEQRIWEEFVQERDIVSSVCQDDPYQFLHELPEACIKELLEIELQRMKNERNAEDVEQQLIPEEMPEPSPPGECVNNNNNQHVVTFVEESDKEDMFHIFDDEKDDEVSGPEEENLNESGSPPCTVRERNSARSNHQSPSKSLSPDKVSSKSSENVSHMIESSIYCAKVKDLRLKLSEELLDIMGTLDRQDLTKIEPEEVSKMTKRSTEFCARFNRIHMYQLQRQLHDIQRHNGSSFPFAKHTHFQAQMVRIGSLHQNLLQAAQIFHKSIAQTACIRESSDLLRSLLRTIIDGTSICQETSPPSGLTAAKDLYTDDVLVNCNKLEDGLNEYSTKLSEYLDQFGPSGKSKRGRYRGKKKSIGTWSKSGTKSGTDTDARLSMYSLDTLRLNLNSKTSISKDHSSGTSKLRGGLTTRRKQTDKDEPPKSQQKSPRSRRPLMRDPAAGKPRRKQTRDLDVPTLVETVTACGSSHISREETPIPTPRDSKDITPRRQKDARSKDCSRKSASPRKRMFTSPKSAKNYNGPIKSTPKSSKDNVETRTKENNENDKTKTPDLGVKKTNNDKLDKTLDIKVEMKPKSPEQLIEQSQRLSKQDTDDLKRGQESPKSKCDVEVQGFKENVAKMDQELKSPQCNQCSKTDGRKSDRDRNKVTEIGPGGCEVSRLLRQLCGGDASGNRNERVSGAKNAQLLCINGGSPRQPSTPQLLRILEETIQKKAPKPLFPKPCPTRDTERLRLPLNVPSQCADRQLQYRGNFVQHMLASAMYANSAVGKPWEVIGSVSDQIIDELLLGCAKEMELTDVVQEMYRCETK